MENTEPICRICLLQPEMDTLMPTESDFITKIEQCTGVELTQDAGIPNKICTSCALLVRAALKLRNLCQLAEVQLQNLKYKSEEPEQLEELPNKSDDELPAELVQSYELTLETASTSGSQSSADMVTIKPATPRRTTVSNRKRKRRSRPALATSQALSTPSGREVSYVCNICRNVYTEKMKLTAHMKVHSMHKPHECEICHKRFRQTPQLARHMNSHTGLRPYKCDFCDSSFADPSTRIKHQRIHTNERPYKCEFCEKTFAYSNVLNVHLKTHTGERPFSCQYCDKRFTQLHHKNTHERVHSTNKDMDYTVITLVEE